jgi:hypothetical protein
MFATIKLITESGDLVGYTKIPAFVSMPTGLAWGERFFFQDLLADNEHGEVYVYREKFWVAIVVPVTDTRTDS